MSDTPQFLVLPRVAVVNHLRFYLRKTTQSSHMTEDQAPSPLEEGECKDDVFEGARVTSRRPSRNTVQLMRSSFSTQMSVAFKDLTYEVKSNRDRKQKLTLLSRVSAVLLPGEMSTLIGPTGSGKTTLLDVLAGRKTVGEVTGTIRFGGAVPSRALLRRYTGYVEQTDTLLGTLTVYENLLYTAELKCSAKESSNEKRVRVEEIMSHLGLSSCRDVCVGSTLHRGISGGEAKRVNIGIALVGNPKVLLLDEPTSGLDSYTSTMVIRCVRSLAQFGITIIATIHSPTSSIFELFDRLLIMLRGNCIYFGVGGEAAVDYFQRFCPEVPKKGEHEAAADWIVDIIAKADWQGHGKALHDAYENSELSLLNSAKISQYLQHANSLSHDEKQDLEAKAGTATPFWHAIVTLFKFRTVHNYRRLWFMFPRLVGIAFYTFLICTLYWRMGDNMGTEDVSNISLMLYMWTILGFLCILYLPTLVLERALFYRELNDGLYTPLTYLISKMVEELGLCVMTTLCASIAIFWLVKLQGSWVLFYLNTLCTMSIGGVLAYFIASVAPNLEVANVALPVYLAFLMFFCGLLLLWDNIPKYWRWMCYLSFLRFGWGGVMVNQFEGDRNVQIYPGVTVLEYYSLEGTNKWSWLGFEFIFFLVFFFLAYLSLRYLRHVTR